MAEREKGLHPDLAAFLVLVFVALFLHLSLTRFSDPDGLYHFRHGSLYLQHGPFWQDFPWTTKSVLAVHGADIWYGFHLLLAPFSLIPDPLLSVRLAAGAMLVVFLVCAYRFAKLYELPWPIAWPLIVLLSAPAQTWRFLALRPYLISLGAALLLFAYVQRSRWLAAAICGYAISVCHASFFWVGLTVSLAALLDSGLSTKAWPWKAFAGGAIGVLGGLLLRPAPIEALQVLRVQLLDLSAVVREGLRLNFGNEVYPLNAGDIFALGYVPAIALTLLLVLPALLRRRVPVGGYGLLGLAIAFLLLSLLQSYRAVDPWVAFMVVAAGVSSKGLSDAGILQFKGAAAGHKALTGLAVSGGIAIMGWSAIGSRLHVESEGLNLYRFQDGMEWLEKNTSEGEIVYNTSWSYFPEMFFWNTHNRYVAGMDPIFLYSFDRGLYWKYHRIEIEAGTKYTSGTAPDDPERPEETYEVLKRDFGAKYLFSVPALTPRLSRYVHSDSRFVKVFAGQNVEIFRL